MTSIPKNTPAITGEDLYNAIMRRIEPDLTTDMLPTLDEYYSFETEEQRKQRAEWYEKVFKQFDLEYAAFVGALKNYCTGLKKKATKLVRSVKENAEKVSTKSIEDSIQNS